MKQKAHLGGVRSDRLACVSRTAHSLHLPEAFFSIFLDRHTKACQFCNGVRKGPLVYLNVGTMVPWYVIQYKY